MRGVFTRHYKHYGFIRREGAIEGERDWYVAQGFGRGAMTGDAVEFRCLFEATNGDRKEAEVTEVITRAITRIVGEFQAIKPGGFFVNGDRGTGRLGIKAEDTLDARDGHKVVAEITYYPKNDTHMAIGKITKIIGHITDPGVDILSIVERYEIPCEFPEEVWEQTRRISEEIAEADNLNRRDLRGLLTITIDGEDAKDLDDAISIERQNVGYRLFVHIADVSQYVTYNSPLFKEALNRGTSCYLADRVIPMLPHKLSNGICSLNPNEDRLAITCEMEIDGDGRVYDSRVYESVINSNRRMTYTEVLEMITNEESRLRSLYGDITDMIDTAEELRAKLHKNRAARGAIDFDTKESKIEVGSDGKAIGVTARLTDRATNLIEEFMILANETVAKTFTEAKLPFVYRTHENPSEEKILALSAFLGRFKIKIRAKHFARDAQTAIADSKGKPEEALVNRLILRSLKQARYTHELIGHFGLALKYYSHFTSPIRRFPDLMIHIIIKSYLRGSGGFAGDKRFLAALPEYCARASMTERRAEQCERETEAMKKAEYMEDKIGWVYDGVISGVTQNSIFVELPNTVEGIVGRTNFTGDDYTYDKDRMAFVGKHTGKEYRLGGKVRIVVKSVNVPVGCVNFELADRPIRAESPNRGRGRGFGANQKKSKGGKRWKK